MNLIDEFLQIHINKLKIKNYYLLIKNYFKMAGANNN